MVSYINRKQVSIDELEDIDCDSIDRETTVQFYKSDTEMEIFTSDNTMMNKFKKLMIKDPDNWKCFEGSRYPNGNISGYFFTAPKKYLRFATAKATPQMSEERKEELRQRMAEMRERIGKE